MTAQASAQAENHSAQAEPAASQPANGAGAPRSLAALVDSQFGPQAAAYVTSPVHSRGEDLDQFAGIVRDLPAKTVLDLGCGGGHMSFAAAPHVRDEVVAYDLSRDMLAAVSAEAARRGLTNIRTEAGRAESLPFADASFCVVATRMSAHHWGDLDAALAEARRVTKRGGRGVFIDVCSPGTPLLDTYLQAMELLRDPSHVRNYSIDEWIRAVTKAGFAAGKVTPRRLRIEFAPWIARIRTPALHAEAIRSLQAAVPEEVKSYFAFEADGTFTFDTMTLEAVAV